jgi:formylglycine-generating enzyme
VAAPSLAAESQPGIRVLPDDGPRVDVRLERPERVSIPAGPFRMGATRDQLKQSEALCVRDLRNAGGVNAFVVPVCRMRSDVEGPAVDVFVPAFAIDRHEVTLAQYGDCVLAGACAPLPDWVPRLARSDERRPVEAVTFWEATRYCQHRGGRLPSEAEWERAARGLGDRLYPWGRYYRDGLANHGQAVLGRGRPDEGPERGGPDARDGFSDSAPVGTFPRGASPYGVLDMAGNVWEWTSGVFSQQPPQAMETFVPDGSLFGTHRTVRGGSYLSPRSALRVTGRWGLPPGKRLRGVGFRCAYDHTSTNDRGP